MSTLNDKQRAYAAAVLNERAARGEFAAAQKESLELAFTLSPMEREDVHIALAEDPSIALAHWHKFDAEQEAEREALRQEERSAVLALLLEEEQRLNERFEAAKADKNAPTGWALAEVAARDAVARMRRAIEQGLHHEEGT